MRVKVANHKGEANWKEMGPSSPMPAGPTGERHTRSGGYEDDWMGYGAYFSTPGHRPLTSQTSNDIETGYTR